MLFVLIIKKFGKFLYIDGIINYQKLQQRFSISLGNKNEERGGKKNNMSLMDFSIKTNMEKIRECYFYPLKF